MGPVGTDRLPAVVCDAAKLSQIAIIQELGRFGVPVAALDASPDAAGFASRYVRRRMLCPIPSYDPAYIRYLIAEAPRGVIFCSNDANAENLSRHRTELLAAGFRMLIPDPATLERVIDKELLYETALACGVSVPKCSTVRSAAELEAAVSELGLPLILKSSNLAGGVYRFVRSADAAPAVFAAMSELVGAAPYRHRSARLLAQPWVPQGSASLWNFNACARDGQILCYSVGRRIRTDVRPDGTVGSVLLFGRTAENGAIVEHNRRLVRHLGFSGIFETEWSEDPDRPRHPWLYDFNPRPSGNIRWAFRSGTSLALQHYRLALGLPPIYQEMKPGIAYAKLFWPQSDALEALTNGRLPLTAKLAVLRDDLLTLARCRRHAVDVFDPADPGPTIRVLAPLGRKLISRLGRFAPRSGHPELHHESPSSAPVPGR